MDKAKAFKILGLHNDASMDDIENRYEILAKRDHYKNMDIDIDLCTKAYWVLKGEPDRSIIIKENASKHYRKWEYLFLLLLIIPILAISFYRITWKAPDLKLILLVIS
jgi:hypothetical protein